MKTVECTELTRNLHQLLRRWQLRRMSVSRYAIHQDKMDRRLEAKVQDPRSIKTHYPERSGVDAGRELQALEGRASTGSEGASAGVLE